MSLYVLDTDTLTFFQLGPAAVARRILARSPADLAVTILTVQEQTLGWYTRLTRCRRDDETARIYQRWSDFAALLGRFRILSFTEAALQRFRQLEKEKRNVSPMDLRIAAVALENKAVLVTHNTRDFSRVPGLTLEDWTE